jgi:hypothetical protein
VYAVWAKDMILLLFPVYPRISARVNKDMIVRRDHHNESEAHMSQFLSSASSFSIHDGNELIADLIAVPTCN